MSELRLLLHAGKRILSSSRSDWICLHRSRFTWFMAASVLHPEGPECRINTRRYGNYRHCLWNVVCALFESTVACDRSHTSPSSLGRFRAERPQRMIRFTHFPWHTVG